MSVISIKAQESKMFIQQISGKNIVRENFDSKGNLTGKQKFIVDKIQSNGKSYNVNIKTQLYDQQDKLRSVYSTTYRCKPGESNILLSVFSINPKRKQIAVSIKSGDFKNLYNLDTSVILKRLRLTMNIESGLLNFLGSKNDVYISDRLLSREKTGWVIKEKITINAYLLRFKIKTIIYEVAEHISISGLLEKQVFNQSNGDYFIITYNVKS